MLFLLSFLAWLDAGEHGRGTCLVPASVGRLRRDHVVYRALAETKAVSPDMMVLLRLLHGIHRRDGITRGAWRLNASAASKSGHCRPGKGIWQADPGPHGLPPGMGMAEA